MVYKDLVAFCQSNKLVPTRDMRARIESNFKPFREKYSKGDTLVDSSDAHNGTHFYEIREWVSEDKSIRITYFFLTRIYSKFARKTIFDFFYKYGHQPDIYIANSTVWDISRYGENSVDDFYQNLGYFFKDCYDLKVDKQNDIAPMIIWRTALPVSEDARGGFLIPTQPTASKTANFRLDIPKANNYILQKCLSDWKEYKVEVIDLHNDFTNFIPSDLKEDGIHLEFIKNEFF